MSKKRSESSTGEKTNKEDSDVFLKYEGDKRVKLTSLSDTDTTLKDLPLELIERIFIRAIAEEVKEMHLAKSVWKAKADLVICRLRTVCPHWSNFLESKLFKNELYRTLDRTESLLILNDIFHFHNNLLSAYFIIPSIESSFIRAIAEEVREMHLNMIRLEILLQSPRQDLGDFPDANTLQDELFILCQGDDMEPIVTVFDRSNVALAKDIVDLSHLEPFDMAACNVSNCLYILNCQKRNPVVVFRIMKEGEHQFTISPFISGKSEPTSLYVAGNGDVILFYIGKSKKSDRMAIYDANGSLRREWELPSNLRWILKLIPRSNDNFVIVSRKGKDNNRTKLMEIDSNGTILRKYQSSIEAHDAVSSAGPHGRIVIVGGLKRIELLDKEFNLLNVICPQLNMDPLPSEFCYCRNLNYDDKRNELITTLEDLDIESPVLFIFHFKEE